MNKNAYIISAIMVGFLILFGSLFFGRKNISSPSSPANTRQTPTSAQTVNIAVSQGTQSAKTTEGASGVMAQATVRYIDGGFMPSQVTVKSGGTVEWINEGNMLMWVASTPHPTHTDLPGFDQRIAVGQGQTYAFTFTKAGTWKYHNHINPTHKGIVVVE